MTTNALDIDLPLEYVYQPPNGDSDRLLVLLHGRGADETDLLPLADHLPSAHVLSLRAPDRLMGGYTWYELDIPDGDLHRSEPHADDFRRSLDLVAETISAAREALEVEQVGLLGFSQGSITGTALLVESPADFDWVVGLHGYLAASHAERDSDLGGTPVFLGAGRADDIIPESRVSTAAEKLAEMGAAVSFEAYDVGHGIGRDELAAVASFIETNW